MLLKNLFNWRGDWYVEGWDTFGGHSYAIPGKYRTRDRAEKAARKYLKHLERTEPTEISGGPDGIQDHVHVRGPDGQNIRIMSRA